MINLEELWRSPGDEGGAPDPEETAPDGSEAEAEAVEETEGSEIVETPEGLDAIPEDYRDLVAQQIEQEKARLAESIRGEAEKGWTQKFQDQSEKLRQYEEYKQIVENFDRRLQEDPEGLLKEMQDRVQTRVQKTPEDPGDPPDPMDYDAYTEWVAKDRAYRNHILKQAVQQQQQQMAPVMELVQERQVRQGLQQTAQQLQVPVEKVEAAYQVLQSLQKNPQQAWRDFIELAEIRSKKATQTQNLKGVEERPGPSRTSVRKPVPRPTGDLREDVAAELESEGIRFPEGE